MANVNRVHVKLNTVLARSDDKSCAVLPETVDVTEWVADPCGVIKDFPDG
jgi:hypothetical protein